LKSPPLLWLGPLLVNRVLRGDSPAFTGKQVREANCGAGMNLLVWEGCIRLGFEQDSEIHRQIMELFIAQHNGYFWKEVIASQSESAERLDWVLKTGGQLWDPVAGRYVASVGKDLREIIREPHFAGVTREMEGARFGLWVGMLFDYRRPKIGLSPSEQRLLVQALSGATDEQLAVGLGASFSTVKNHWRSIYNRAASCLPEVFSSLANEEPHLSGRGKEKRRLLLAYLREHPEELRPVSRRLLQQSGR
jgi:hypothetical protein